MRAFRAKTRNRTPCHGVIGGITEIPPDTKSRRKRKRKIGTRFETMFNTTATSAARVHPSYDNANVTTPGLVRVFIACFVFMIILILVD